MRGGRFFSMLLGATLVAAFPTSVNAQSADEYADEWTEARRGDRTWTQRATEQLTTGITERVMGRPPQGPMKVAVNYVHEEVVRMRTAVRVPCLAAAMEKAHDQILASGRQEVMAGSLDMLLSAAGGAAGGGEIRQFLSR